ncbi:MAG: 50S ribosomal protein L24 [Firmicutes bacterium RBG_13_65_8]|nr:MAG: 50S ribosomal protein L24 [Firmicutes bacterium RBG_13_65_8]
MARTEKKEIHKIHVRKGDTVIVLSGKDAGKRGKVVRAVPSDGRVVVEGVNMIKKHMRPTQKVMQGGIVNQEAPLASAKVMLVCSRCGKPVRPATKVLADGRMVRACRKCGEVLDK